MESGIFLAQLKQTCVLSLLKNSVFNLCRSYQLISRLSYVSEQHVSASRFSPASQAISIRTNQHNSFSLLGCIAESSFFCATATLTVTRHACFCQFIMNLLFLSTAAKCLLVSLDLRVVFDTIYLQIFPVI